MNYKDYRFIVFCVEHCNPLGVIRNLGECGAEPIAIVVKDRQVLASKSKYISKLHMVDSIQEGYELLISVYGSMNDKKTFLYSSDDKIISCLDSHYEQLKDHFIFFNGGRAGRLNHYMNKEVIEKAGGRHGLSVLPIHVTRRGEIPENLEYPVITKSISPIVGGWKDDVFICRNESELRDAFQKIQSETVLLQKYIVKKNELAIEGMSVNHGESVFLASAINFTYNLPEKYSARLTVNNFRLDEIGKKVSSLISDIGFEGICEVEFLIDQDDNYYFSEINFRTSPWSFATAKAGINLPVLWAESMLEGRITEAADRPIKENFTAMVEPTDFHNRVMGHRIGFFKWIKEFNESDCKFFFYRKDLKPLIFNAISRLKNR